MYHPDHFSLGHSFQEELKLMLAHIHLFLWEEKRKTCYGLNSSES